MGQTDTDIDPNSNLSHQEEYHIRITSATLNPR